jgi:hypothetical protein
VAFYVPSLEELRHSGFEKIRQTIRMYKMHLIHLKLRSSKLPVLMATTGALLASLPGSSEAQEPSKVATDQVTAWMLIQQSPQYLECRALDAAIWGMPLVNFDAMRQALFRDIHGGYNDILYQSRVADWKFQVTTPNNATPYVMLFINTKQDGPVVVEIPPATDNALFGTLIDAWNVPLIDVGKEGDDQGKGGKYLLLPPDYKGEVPAGYIPVPSKTYNSYSVLRVITKSLGDEDMRKGIAYLKQTRIYPLTRANAPQPTRFIEISGKLFDGVPYFNASFYESLSRMINEEPVQQKDLAILGMIWPLGIEKGKEFKPNQQAQTAITTALPDALAKLENAMLKVGARWWNDRRWRYPVTEIGPKTGLTFETPVGLAADDRAATFFFAFGAPKKLGAATFYLKVGLTRAVNCCGEGIATASTCRPTCPRVSCGP